MIKISNRLISILLVVNIINCTALMILLAIETKPPNSFKALLFSLIFNYLAAIALSQKLTEPISTFNNYFKNITALYIICTVTIFITR